MNAVPEFQIDPSTPLTDSLTKAIKIFGLKETIDCLISAIELGQEQFDDECKEFKNKQLIIDSLTQVSSMAECLSALEVHAIHETHEFKVMQEQQKRRRIMADMLLNIAQIEVM